MRVKSSTLRCLSFARLGLNSNFCVDARHPARRVLHFFISASPFVQLDRLCSSALALQHDPAGFGVLNDANFNSKCTPFWTSPEKLGSPAAGAASVATLLVNTYPLFCGSAAVESASLSRGLAHWMRLHLFEL